MNLPNGAYVSYDLDAEGAATGTTIVDMWLAVDGEGHAAGDSAMTTFGVVGVAMAVLLL